MYSLLFLGFASFILSLFLTPLVRSVFLRLGVVDLPDPKRKFHKHPIPHVGGIAIVLSYSLAFAFLLLSHLSAGSIIRDASPLIWKLMPAAVLIFVTGLLDDLLHINPWQKLVGQIAAAIVAYFGGIQIAAIGGQHFHSWLSFPATVIWLVACSNAVNLIDGLDGVATGVALVATVTTCAAALIQGNVELGLATVPLAGCLLAFLRYNFNPATIFLGDSGSLFIGFLLGCYGVLWSEKSTTMFGMAAPLIALSIPLLDTSLAIARRLLRGQPIFTADRGHIHHRLLDLGLSHKQVALVLYGIGALFAAFSLAIVNHHFEIVIIVVFCALISTGVQRLGYIEFDTAGRMLLQGSFRKLLRSQISLRTFETNLSVAKTPDECWAVLKNAYQDFGFCTIQLKFAGATYSETSVGESDCAWRVEIPLRNSGYVHLTREFGPNRQHNIVAPFADVLRQSLESKLTGPVMNSKPEKSGTDLSAVANPSWVR